MNQDNSKKNQLMDDHDFDLHFKTQLEHFEVKPDIENWAKINLWRPFAFLFSFPKNNILRIAASLFFILTASTLFFQFNIKNNHSSKISIATEKKILKKDNTPITNRTPSKQEDFVLDIKSEIEDKDVRIEIIEKEIDEYLAFLLADDDEFASNIDASQILKSLEPAEQLPLDDMFAYIPEIPKQEVFTILNPLETKIVLPHRFLKADESIEDYLLIYEKNQINN